MSTANVTALRGTLVSFAGDPFLDDPAHALRHESDGLIVCRDGLIEAAGAYTELRSQLPQGIQLLIIPVASSRRVSSTRMSTMCRPR
jgi:hypothetical protein